MVDNIRLPIASPDFGRMAIQYDDVGSEIIFETNLKYSLCSVL